MTEHYFTKTTLNFCSNAILHTFAYHLHNACYDDMTVKDILLKIQKFNYKNQYSDILVYFNLHFRKNAMLVEFISLKISLKSEFGAFLIIFIMKMWIIYQIMRTLILRFSEFSL